MVDDFAERIAAIAAQKQAEQDKATKDEMEKQADLIASKQRIIPVVDHWNRFIAPTVNAKVAAVNQALRAYGVQLDASHSVSRTVGAQVVLRDTPIITVQPVLVH